MSQRPESNIIWLFRRIQHGQILNVDEGSLWLYSALFQIRSGHTAVPWEQDKYLIFITDEADRNQGWRRTIQQSEVCVWEDNDGVRQKRDKYWWELSESLCDFLWTVYWAHALITRVSWRIPDHERGILCFPSHGSHKGEYFQVQRVQSSTALHPRC